MFKYTYGESVGSGKSLTLADEIIFCLRENIANQKRYNLPVRELWVNMPINTEILKKYPQIKYWEKPAEMIFTDYPYNTKIRRDFDCFIDELAGYLASDKWRECPDYIRKFFARHRKRGIRIYGNTQDYMMLDINARRMATRVSKVRKMCGSPDPAPNLPPVKHVWGIIVERRMDKKSCENDALDAKPIGLPKWHTITRFKCNFYDMSAEVTDLEEPELVHKVRKCKVCGLEKCYHV